MKIIEKASTTKETFAKAVNVSSSCCGADCKLLCKKCPPMKE